MKSCIAKNSMIATGNSLAVTAGKELLECGGSVVNVAITADIVAAQPLHFNAPQIQNPHSCE